MAMWLGEVLTWQIWKKTNSQQEHALSNISNKGKFERTCHLFKSNKILNVYQLNVLINLLFMHKIEIKTTPYLFLSNVQVATHIYPTR